MPFMNIDTYVRVFVLPLFSREQMEKGGEIKKKRNFTAALWVRAEARLKVLFTGLRSTRPGSG